MMLLLGTFVLVGCGGGGGSSTSEEATFSYSGKTSKVILDENNTQYFVELVNASFSNTVSTTLSPKVNKIASLHKMSQKIIEDSAPNMKVTDSTSIEGKISGQVSVVTEETGSYTATITYTYKNFSDVQGIVVNGKVINYLTVNSNEVLTKSIFAYEMLNIKIQGEDVTLDGKITSTPTASGSTLVENYVAKNNKTSEMIKYDNYETHLNKQGQIISYGGKIYDSNYGYVNVSTLSPLAYNEDGSPKAEGEIFLEGETSSATIKYAYDNRVRVEIDVDKDGSSDDVQVYQAGNYEQEIPNAAPVIYISFPQSIYTDTDMSAVKVTIYDPDLDGFTVTNQWQINGVDKSTEVILDNTLFVKHDMLKLTVSASDDRVGNTKTSTKMKEQEVLNSVPRAFIESNTTSNEIEALSTVQFDASSSTDNDTDPLTYQWKVYKYIPEEEHRGEPIIETVWPDDLDPNGDIVYSNLIIEVNSSEYFNDTTLEKPIFNANVEGKHIVLCTVFDDDKAENTTEFNLTIKPLDIIKSTESKVFFDGQDTLGEWTFNSTIKAFDLNNDNNKELVYLTRNPVDPYSTLLHITHDAKNSNQVTQSYSVNVLNSSSLDFSEFNGDGRVDILLRGMNKDYVMIQSNDGTFKNPIEVNRSIRGIYIDDFNGDGKGDVVELYGCELIFNAPYSNYNEDALLRYTVNACDEGSYKNSNILKVADFNNDGIQDFMVMTPNTYNGKAKFVIVYRDNNKVLVEGPLVEIKQRVGTNISIADLTRDGFNDILFGFILFENNKDLTFKKIVTLGTKENGSTNDRIVITDINNDAKEDILYHNADTLRVLVQGDNYQMSDFEIKSVIDNIVIADIDNDGKTEIVENYQNRIEITSFR